MMKKENTSHNIEKYTHDIENNIWNSSKKFNTTLTTSTPKHLTPHITYNIRKFVLKQEGLSLKKGLQYLHHIFIYIGPKELIIYEKISRKTTFSYKPFFNLSENNFSQNHTLDQNEKSTLLQLFSFHENGYLREKVLMKMDTTDPFSIPYLLIRLNDWVSEIHYVAGYSLNHFLSQHIYHPIFIQYSFLLSVLERARRTSHALILQSIRKNVFTPEIFHDIKEGFLSDVTLSRNTYVQFLNNPKINPDEVRIFGLQHSNPIIKLQASSPLKKFITPKNIGIFYNSFKTNRYYPIRKKALYLVEKLQHNDLQMDLLEELKYFITDKNSLIRFQTRKLIERNFPNFDIKTYYKSLLTKEKEIGALLGLGEVGSTSDIQLLRDQYSQLESVLFKKTIIFVLAKNGPSHLFFFTQKLFSKILSLSAAAKRALIYHQKSIDLNKLLEQIPSKMEDFHISNLFQISNYLDLSHKNQLIKYLKKLKLDITPFKIK